MKLFASDFDGTLRRYDRKEPSILKEDLEAIASYRAKGHLFGMCSGRAFDSILHAAAAIPQADFYVVTTGAVIGRMNDGKMEMLYEQEIEREYARKVFERYGNEQKIFYTHLNGYLYRIKNRTDGEHAQICVPSFDDLPAGVIEGVSIGTDSATAAKRITDEINRDFAGIIRAFQNNDYLDCVSHGCSKGEGVRRLRKMYEADLIGGIGDSFNDIPLLDEADVSFTFDFSPDEVKKHADYIVKTAAEALGIFTDL